MRPSANFTLHAILAACLAALAASSAAAQSPPTLRIVTETPGGAVLNLQGFKWGTTQDPKQYGEWIADVERPAQQGWYAPGNTKYPNVKLSRGSSSAQDSKAGVKTDPEKGHLGRGVDIAAIDGEPVTKGASGRVTGIASDPADAASGLPTGKRQHKPFVLTKPLDKGSVWIRVASPWSACRVGTHYPSLELSDGNKRYQLQDVSVASCGQASADRPTEEVAFYYNRIAFQYAH